MLQFTNLKIGRLLSWNILSSINYTVREIYNQPVEHTCMNGKSKLSNLKVIKWHTWMKSKKNFKTKSTLPYILMCSMTSTLHLLPCWEHQSFIQIIQNYKVQKSSSKLSKAVKEELQAPS